MALRQSDSASLADTGKFRLLVFAEFDRYFQTLLQRRHRIPQGRVFALQTLDFLACGRSFEEFLDLVGIVIHPLATNALRKGKATHFAVITTNHKKGAA